MKSIIEKVKEQISELKSDIVTITNQIEKLRSEADESDVSITNELQDRLEIISEKIAKLQTNLETYKSNTVKKEASVGKTLKISNGQIKNKYVTIVLPEDADPRLGMISVESPLGKSVINKRVGEDVRFETPAGAQIFKIEAIQ